MEIKNLIVGAGLSGIVLANKIANELKQEVFIIEQRNHIGGNCYDYYDENGILIHKYGPHVFHTNYKEIWDYLNKYTIFNNYQHKACVFVDGNYINLPFNFNSIYKIFSREFAEELEETLLKYFNFGDKISILELLEISKKKQDKKLVFISNFVYEKIFKNYSLKQWGVNIEKIDKNILSRVKINLSRDDRYFQNKYQGLPEKGYTNMFKKMLDSKYIHLMLNTSFNDTKITPKILQKK